MHLSIMSEFNTQPCPFALWQMLHTSISVNRPGKMIQYCTMWILFECFSIKTLSNTLKALVHLGQRAFLPSSLQLWKFRLSSPDNTIFRNREKGLKCNLVPALLLKLFILIKVATCPLSCKHHPMWNLHCTRRNVTGISADVTSNCCHVMCFQGKGTKP